MSLEKCDIPISKKKEDLVIQAIYNEVENLQRMPSRFSENYSKLPQFSIFIFAKMRCIFVCIWEPEMLCLESSIPNDIHAIPVFASVRSSKEGNCVYPAQQNVITLDQ